MNSVENLKPAPVALAPEADVEGFLGKGERMLAAARGLLIELEARHGRRRQETLHRMADEIRRIDVEHEAARQRVSKMIARLEALRDG
jgi:hypothetical protein